MYYEVTNPIDGERIQRGPESSLPPTSLRLISDPSEARPGTFVLDQTLVENNPTWLWDAANSTLREPTMADVFRIAKREKITELRDEADRWYRTNIRSFEGAVVIYKSGAGATELNAEEQKIRQEMNDNYVKLRQKIVSVNNIKPTNPTQADVDAVKAIKW